MYTIKELIEERALFAVGSKKDLFNDELLSSVIRAEQQEEIAFITYTNILNDEKSIEAIKCKYYIAGVYKLGQIFTNVGLTFYVLHLSAREPKGLNIAFFKGKPHNEKPRLSEKLDGTMGIPLSYSKEWTTYIELLEKWMNGGSVPASSENYEFNVANELYGNSYFPEKYSKELIGIRELLKQQNSKPLSDMADILSPKTDRNNNVEQVKLLTAARLEYPLNLDLLREDSATSVILKKGDVVIPKFRKRPAAYLFDYDGEEKVYASYELLVIRCKSILPEYLYLYLLSETAIKVWNANSTSNTFVRITMNDLSSLPIAPPKEDKGKYRQIFFALTHSDVRDYDQQQRYTGKFGEILSVPKAKKPDTVEDILNIELADTIEAYKEEQLRSFLSDDLKELNACFRAKAYKATLILAGSILEAVLIDWLSEINHTDYFENDYYVTDRRGNPKRADLIDYINEIKYIKRPRWMEEAEKAHTIRKKRNLVHAKLCMRGDEVNELVCREVISYLSDVLQTRGRITSSGT